MTDKTREDFEAWARPCGYELRWSEAKPPFESGYDNSPAHHAWDGYQAATQHSAARIAELEAECDAIAELNHAQWVALENVRHLAARNRKEEWAQHLLRFVEQAGTNKAQIMRRQVEQAQAEAVPSDVVRDAERYRWLRDKGFAYADVDLGTDMDGQDYVSYRIRFHLPEPAHSKFEADEWASIDIDAAIDAAMKQRGGV